MSAHERADRLIARTAARQHGVFSRSMALNCGLPSNTIDRRLKSGDYWMLWPGVYTLPQVPNTWEQTAMAAVIHAGPVAALSGPAAARKLEIPAFDRARLEVSTTRQLTASGLALRDRTPLVPDEIVKRDGIPVTMVERTVLDLSSCLDEARLEGALDAVFHLRLTAPERLTAYLAQTGLPRRRRALVLKLLSDRGDVAPAQSMLETGLARLLRHRSLPPAVRQYEIRDGRRRLARPDFAFPEARLGVEGHSFRFHGSKLQWEQDVRREASVEAAGWRLIYVTYWDTAHRVSETRARIRRIYDERRQTLNDPRSAGAI